MQAIPWTKAEFQAGVNKKLAALRALRGNPEIATASFDQRLQMANHEVAHAQAQEDLELRRQAAEQGRTVNYRRDPDARRAAMKAKTAADLNGILLGRFGDAEPYPRKPNGFTAADDSYGASEVTLGAPGHEPNAKASGGGDPREPDHFKENTDYTDQLRLLASNARQASDDWVVLDRAALLHKLLDHPAGMTLTQWAAALGVLSREATVALIAARMLASGQTLDADDEARLARAVSLIEFVRGVFHVC